MSKLICLQAGHENVTTGSTGAPGEQELNKRIRARLTQLLIERKFQVQLVDANPPASEISKDFHLFLSLHGDANIYGTGGGCIAAPDPAYDDNNAESVRIKNAIESEYFKHSEIVNHPERVNRNMTMYYMWSRLSSMTPCVIIEMGVVQDPHDKVLLTDTDRIANALCRGICKAFNVPFDLVETPPPPSPLVAENEALKKRVSTLEARVSVLETEKTQLTDKLNKNKVIILQKIDETKELVTYLAV